MRLVPGRPKMRPELRAESRKKLRPDLKLKMPNLKLKMKVHQLAMLILLVGSLSVTAAYADSHKKGNRGTQATPSNLVEDSQSVVKITSRAAASKVKQRYPGSRVLGVSLLDKSGSPMYRVKTLSTDGVVKSVFVDGNSGAVFE